MVDIREIATILTLQHNKNIFLNLKTNEWLFFTNIQFLRAEAQKNKKILDFIENKKDYVSLFPYEDKILLEDIKMYLEKHQSVKDLIKDNITVTRFIQTIKNDNVLFNDWIEYFMSSISFEVHYWVKDYSLIEMEAPKDYYTKIRELFLKCMNTKPYRFLADNQIITIDGYDPTHVVIMGNAGITYGLSFYLGDNALEHYKYDHSVENPSITDYSLNETLGIYLETNNQDKFFRKTNSINQFGEDGEVTSIYSNIGFQYNCFLPFSLAIKIIKYLTILNERLPKFFLSNEFKKLDTNEFNEIILLKNGIDINTFNGKKINPDYYPYNFEDHMPCPIKKASFDNHLNYEITLRRATSYVCDKKDSRIMRLVYILLIVNRDTGKIVTALMNNEKYSDPILSIYKEFEKYLRNNQFARNIYVNNFCDFSLLQCFLFYFADKKQIKIIALNEHMLIDDVWNQFDAAINNIDDSDFDA